MKSTYPSDWPAPGPIDLAIHDLPHASSALEWWYVNSHLETSDGRQLAIFAAFFREAKGRNESTGEVEYAHFITWALSDPGQQKYYPSAVVDAGSPAFGLRKIDAGAGVADERLNRALREVLSRGRVPGPTRMFNDIPLVGMNRLDLDYAGDRFAKRQDGSYVLHLCDDRTKTGCDLIFVPAKLPIRHGNEGVIHGVSDELMFYYFIPRCHVSGSVVVEGRRQDIVRGSGWYDHEFGFVPKKKTNGAAKLSAKDGKGPTAWNWASLQLDGGIDVTVYSITRIATGEPLDNWAILSDRQGRRTQYSDVSFQPVEMWSSTRSFVEYPTRWRLTVPEAKLDLEVEATFPDQEVLTIISDPGFWEGQVRAKGTLRNVSVSGLGWVERKGFRFNDLDQFFKAAGREVQKQVAKVLPLDPSRDELASLVVRKDGGGAIEGLDAKQIGQMLVKPIRDVIDRGGKSWRSYAALACINVVGGDSRKFLHWLAIPEILHVGSLIVDDVEDQSEIRRGAPTCHLLHGEPLAINAGTAAYFLAEPPVENDDLPPETKLRIYRLYFDGMRAGHAGQAADIAGLNDIIAAAVSSGDVTKLEARVMAIHRLKTAVPASMFAKIGGILGSGTEIQIEGLGRYFEAIGLAFQIIDDVLNLRGFKGNLKERGEDIRHGKMTLPIVKAIGLLPEDERRSVWEVLASKPRDQETVLALIDKIERAGAIDVCSKQARDLVEDAWKRLDPLIPDSQSKIIFRAFGWYVLERHY